MWDSPRMRRRGSAGKTRDRQIKATPEKVHRTAFAAKARSKLLKHAIALDEDTPKPICVFAVVRAMLFILIEGDRVFDLVRHGVDGHRQLKIAQCLHYRPIKLDNRLRF